MSKEKKHALPRVILRVRDGGTSRSVNPADFTPHLEGFTLGDIDHYMWGGVPTTSVELVVEKDRSDD